MPQVPQGAGGRACALRCSCCSRPVCRTAVVWRAFCWCSEAQAYLLCLRALTWPACPACLLAVQVAHVEQSPLLLCDTCPRSFHQACLGLSAAELPSGDWCCPKCVDSTQAALRRVMDGESRRLAASERAAARERAAEDKAAKRAVLIDRDRKKVCWRVCGSVPPRSQP